MVRFLTFIMAVMALTAAVLSTLFSTAPVYADLRTPTPPGWYDPDGVHTGSDWHYRVPVTLPASSSVNSTATVDVNFATLLTQLSVSGTFDINSIRVVRPNGSLAATQEFTDTRFGNATDTTGNNRGEVRWIVQDGGAQTYYIYFDITQNGAKAANAQPKINGNFEHDANGAATATGWNAPIIIGSIDRAVRSTETPTITSNPTALDGATRATDGSPRTGANSFLFGHRSFASANSDPGFTMTRAITVPATNPGSLTFRWRPEGWDSGNFDFVRIDLTTANTAAAASLIEMVGPTQGNYATRPFSPNPGGSTASNTTAGYRHYNGYDCTRTGTHTLGMTVPCFSQPWWEVTQDLSAYAGQTIFIRFRSYSDAADKTWYHIDDIEWSLVTGTLGTAEGFGVAITQPTAGTDFSSGQTMFITAAVDARPTGAGTPVTANILNPAGTVMASGIVLFNDGTHGDTVAGDAIYSNNGSDAAFPTYTIPNSQPNETGWIIRVFARDASTTTVSGGTNGHVKRDALPNPAIEANYWNIDDSVFDIVAPVITIAKNSSVISDPVNGTNSPKAIPGAIVRYCITFQNSGTFVATNVIGTDNLPSDVLYQAGTLRSGATCSTAATVEDDDNTGTNETDPVGAWINATEIKFSIPTLAASTGQSFTYDVQVLE
jgi:uncharacterized repeat protein (TIGR01451 family)